MLPLRKKISDLKNRPLNWDRAPHVMSKNEYFLPTWGDVMSRKNDPKKSEWRGILTTKRSVFGQFWEVSKKWQKMEHFKAKFIQKKTLFCDHKKRNQIDLSYRSKRGAGRSAGRSFEILSGMSIWRTALWRVQLLSFWQPHVKITIVLAISGHLR